MGNLRIVRLVAWREIRERARSKAFLVSTAVSLVILTAVVLAAGLASDDEPTRYEVGVVGDEATAVGESLRHIARSSAADGTGERPADQDDGGDGAFEVEVTELDDAAAAEARVTDGDLDAALVPPTSATGTPGETAATGETGETGDTGEAAASVAGPALEVVVDEDLDSQLGNLLHAARQVAAAGGGQAPAADEGAELAVRPLHPVDPGEEDRDALLAVGTIVLYAQLLGFGFWVASGILEEKTSRVVELLLAKLPPTPLLAGKITGIGLLAFVHLVGFVAYGLLLAGPVTGALDLPPGTPGVVAQVLGWFVLGYVLYSCLFAVGGAIASRPEEQSTTMPVTFLAMASFFAAVAATGDPEGVVARVATFVPTAAPLVLPVRAAAGAAAPWEVAAGVALVLATIVVVVRFTARAYAGAALFNRGSLKLREALARAER
jgi:ABC-2 type transport system permease protein